MEWVAQGYKPRDVADFLGLSFSAAKGHFSNIYGKLGVKKRREAIVAIDALPRPTQPVPGKRKRFTPDQVVAIRARLAAGERSAALAVELGISRVRLARLVR